MECCINYASLVLKNNPGNALLTGRMMASPRYTKGISLINVQKLWDKTVYTYEGLRTDMVKLHIVEVGLKGFFNMWYGETNPEWNPTVFGRQYNSVTEIDYYAYDKIIYVGYKYMKVPKELFTLDDLTVYGHVMIGYRDREAEIWYNMGNSEIVSDSSMAFGVEELASDQLFQEGEATDCRSDYGGSARQCAELSTNYLKSQRNGIWWIDSGEYMNDELEKKLKTGTTTVGMIYKGGVLLASDT